jgi:predicted short-subunit dehydrogenase-like oxidoreductase (DUF2520 family)
MMNYAIIGGGRLARHFTEYFRLLEISHTCWVRDRGSPFNSHEIPDDGLRLRKTVASAERVLLLVSDNAIAALLKQYPFLYENQLIHCSGALSFPGIAATHPLMTFTDQLYDIETYQSVPFVCEAGYSFTEMFPALPNPHFEINVEDKARYHAMCVMAGNFTQVLWKAVSDRFEGQFEWPAGILQPYLKQVLANFTQAPESALTGPLVRNDQSTIKRNINALDGDALQDLYSAFIRFYQVDEQLNPDLNRTRMEKVKLEQRA